ncbi:MAG: hypothetical protein WC725_00485 [Patescibacteria group bacterium]|jgi:hypothetical protein
MKVSRYCIEYTNGEVFTLGNTFGEVKEFFAELLKLNWAGMNEEWQDILIFLQIWMYYRFKIDGEMWEYSRESAKKFMDRVEIWHDIYQYAGLARNTSNFCGNYKRPEKVVKQLAKYGIGAEMAREAYDRIVIGV